MLQCLLSNFVVFRFAFVSPKESRRYNIYCSDLVFILAFLIWQIHSGRKQCMVAILRSLAKIVLRLETTINSIIKANFPASNQCLIGYSLFSKMTAKKMSKMN